MLYETVCPAYRMAVTIGHNAVKLAFVAREHQGQKVTVALPQRQLENAVDFDPFEIAFGLRWCRAAEKRRTPRRSRRKAATNGCLSLARKNSFVHKPLPQGDSEGIVYVEEGDGDAADRGTAEKVSSAPAKMAAPFVTARIKQRGELAFSRI